MPISHSTARPAAYLLILLALAAGCSGAATPAAVLTTEHDVTRAVQTGLEQRVTITPALPATGEDITITSVITNRGSQAVALESRICGLTLDGTLRLELPPDVLTCGGYSMGGTIAPGESRQSSLLQRVVSPAGTYRLRVQHALQPQLWVEMRVVVRSK